MSAETCERCEGILLSNKAYRVRSEDNGLSMLDKIVCYACHLEAQNLGLQTEELEHRQKRVRRVREISTVE
jgi:RNase P subunit RPR2